MNKARIAATSVVNIQGASLPILSAKACQVRAVWVRRGIIIAPTPSTINHHARFGN